MSVPRFQSTTPLRTLTCLLGAIALCAPGSGWSDYCEGRVQTAMAQMLDQRSGPVARAERDEMQQALMSLCSDALQAGGGETPVAPRSDLPEDDEAVAEDEKSNFFGIDFKKADEDAAGRDRLKKTH